MPQIKLHDKLMQNQEWYAKWHQVPNSQVYHWVILFFFVGLVLISLLLRIDAALLA